MRNNNSIVTRRSLISGAAGIFGVTALPMPAIAVPTPSTTEGPFYPEESMRFADIDNDLVKIEGEVAQAGGEVVHLKGRVLRAYREPVPNARVEIWQCDMNGRYIHTGDTGGAEHDPAFQGFGHYVTGFDGAYEFRTIHPVAYAGRTPHIHVKVITEGRSLTTQFYVANESSNSRDWLYTRLSEEERKAVEMNFEPGPHGRVANVDIVI